MEEKTIRREAKKRLWYIIGTRPYGKAHIVADDHFGNTHVGGTLCGVVGDDDNLVRWRDLCRNCKRIATARLTAESTPL